MPKKIYSIRPGFRLTVSDPNAPDGVAHKFHGDLVSLDDETAEQYRDAIKPVDPPVVSEPEAQIEAPAPAEAPPPAGDESSQ